MNENDFDSIVGVMAEYTSICDGERKIPLANEMEFHFAGKYGELFRWLGFALKVNYLGFLKGQDILSILLENAKKVKESKSQNGLTGTSIGS